jgi:pimeloyl-ACP methyl ester carboxylesterase
MRVTMTGVTRFVAIALLAGSASLVFGGRGMAQAAPHAPDVLSIDHYVRVESTAPSMKGEIAQIYVRERAAPSTVFRSLDLEGRVVLFVHGAGTPAEVAFDAPYEGFSWMAHHAEAGFDAFSVDMTGYGLSTRPTAMNDPCNLSEEQQADLVPSFLDRTCAPSFPYRATTSASDWHDIDGVVDYLRKLRGVDRVSLVGWSAGGPRAAGYAALHPDKVDRIVLLAPAYNRAAPAEPPANLPVAGPAMNKQTHHDFEALWNRQVGCVDQYEPAVSAAVWGAMLASDPVGATWGPGLRRAPQRASWGWTQEVVRQTATPMLLVAGIHDGQVPPARVRQMYDDLGSQEKVLLDLGCSSHNAMWEMNRTLLFDASLEWLTSGTVDGLANGVVRKGY